MPKQNVLIKQIDSFERQLDKTMFELKSILKEMKKQLAQQNPK